MVNWLILAVMIWMWAIPSDARREVIVSSHVRLSSPPAQMRKIAALRVPPNGLAALDNSGGQRGMGLGAEAEYLEPDAGAEIPARSWSGLGESRWVCAKETPVRWGPQDDAPISSVLVYGTEVQIGERNANYPGWIMWHRAEWIREGDLCR